MHQHLRIFVLPPLLTLAIVVPTLMALMDYLSVRSARTTYVAATLKQGKPCSFCHSGFFGRSTRRVAALRFRALTP